MLTGPSPTFWYRVLDSIHHWQLALPALIPGIASIHRRAWIRLFYRCDPDDTSMRGWERFKRTARDAGIARDERPVLKEELGGGYAGAFEGYLHLHIEQAYELAFRRLGAPHPGGEEAEIAALEQAEAERRTIPGRAEALAAFAETLAALETKRRAEEDSARRMIDQLGRFDY